MNLNKFTEKAQAAVLAAPQLASALNHGQAEPEHLLITLAEQPNGVVPSVLRQREVGPAAVAGAVRAPLATQPKVHGGSEPQFSPHVRVAFDAAQAEAKAMQDEDVSTEHLLLGLLTETGKSVTVDQLKANGITREKVLEALSAIRGSQRVTDQNPEGKYEVLEKYGRDLTELARKGKLDPVIGRDEEVRRVIQVLSRRTKNNPVLIGEMIGAPPGYVGYDEAGQLTEAVRRRPYAVVLFDEVEKAHLDVLNVLLQLLDDGRLTDGKGRVVDFSNMVIIMTSNLRDLDALRGHFRPEFINRIDDIVFFRALDRAHIRQIVDIQLRGLLTRLADRKIHITLNDAAKDFLVSEGYDPIYGARPLKRALQRLLLDPQALRVLDGEFRDGDTVAVELSRLRQGFGEAGPGKLSFAKGQPVHV